jgi:ataxin-10
MENELYSFALDVLRVIHEVGKESTNIFSPSDSLKAEGDIEHMTEGFKSHLIRLIGNLCYKNKENQDKVRLFLGVPHIIVENRPFRI